MRVDVVFSPAALAPGALAGRTALVVDVIRASTTIATALAGGARAIVPCLTPEEARARVPEFPPGEALLGGERRALKVSGFSLGNSPREYMGERIREKTILLTTSNGTRAVLAAREAVALGVVGFVNLSAASRWALDAGRDVTIVCAGELGGFSLEDAVCGGMVVERLQRSGAGLVLGDGARAAGLLFRHYDGRVSEVLADCEWGRELARVGFGADLDLCGRVDCLSVVPVLCGGRLVPAPP